MEYFKLTREGDVYREQELFDKTEKDSEGKRKEQRKLYKKANAYFRRHSKSARNAFLFTMAAGFAAYNIDLENIFVSSLETLNVVHHYDQIEQLRAHELGSLVEIVAEGSVIAGGLVHMFRSIYHGSRMLMTRDKAKSGLESVLD